VRSKLSEEKPNCAKIDIERKYRLLKVCYVPATSAASSKAFFAVANNSTNETNNIS
jgi:hypothetical protein